MPTDDAPPRKPALPTALAVLALVAAVPLLWVAWVELRDHPDVHQIPLQLAGSRAAACRVIQPGAAGCPVPEAAVARYRSAVRGDGWLVAGYVLAGLGVFGLCARLLYGSGARRVARWCLGGVLLAGAADAGENLALLSVLGARRVTPGPRSAARSPAIPRSPPPASSGPGRPGGPTSSCPRRSPTPPRPPSRPASGTPAPTSSGSCTPRRPTATPGPERPPAAVPSPART